MAFSCKFADGGEAGRAGSPPQLVVAPSWGAKGHRCSLGGWGGGDFPEGSVSMRTRSGVIEGVGTGGTGGMGEDRGDRGDGGQVGVRLPDLHRGLRDRNGAQRATSALIWWWLGGWC